ncbi:MAG: hypothetical protein L0229_26000 [Blastocatellia bacterium]|nr:hypothetical protein [Blastocatellia bacterium]
MREQSDSTSAGAPAPASSGKVVSIFVPYGVSSNILRKMLLLTLDF